MKTKKYSTILPLYLDLYIRDFQYQDRPTQSDEDNIASRMKTKKYSNILPLYLDLYIREFQYQISVILVFSHRDLHNRMRII